MMNNTYSQIIAQSERAWSFQWARTLFALERRLDDEEKLFHLKEYAINLASSIEEAESDGGGAGSEGLGEDARERQREERPKFVPGLMIIKRTDCTRAELKRRLVSNWRVSREVLMSEGSETRS